MRNDIFDYVDQLSKYYFKDDDDFHPNTDWYISFVRSYEEVESKFPKSFDDFKKDIGINAHISAFGLDIEIFWYFTLFLFHISKKRTKSVHRIKSNSIEPFEKFQEVISSLVRTSDKGIKSIDDEVTIEIKVNGKKKISIDDKTAINWIGETLNIFKDKIKEGELLSSYKVDASSYLQNIKECLYELPESDPDYDSLITEKNKVSSYIENIRANEDYMFVVNNKIRDKIWDFKENTSKHYRNYFFIKYLIQFLNLQETSNKRSKDSHFNKYLFASKLLFFCGLVDDTKDEIYSKNTLRHYKSMPFDENVISVGMYKWERI